MALFVGFVLPPKKNESDAESGGESDSDDDFEDHDLQDMQKIAAEKMCCSSSHKLRYVVKRMQELSPANGAASATNEWRVRAQFDPLFSHPWWKVEIQTNVKKSSRDMKVASSRPSYSSRTDDAVGEDILSLFLIKGCGVADTYAKELIEFIKRSNFRPTLVDLQDNLAKFANSGQDNGNMAEQIIKCLQSSCKFPKYIMTLIDIYKEMIRKVCGCKMLIDNLLLAHACFILKSLAMSII